MAQRRAKPKPPAVREHRDCLICCLTLAIVLTGIVVVLPLCLLGVL